MIDDLLGYIDDRVYKKAASYCAYQERCQQEVREKLHSWKVILPDAEKIIAKLIGDNFINEERFAVAYAGGKFRMKQWGRLKIKHALEQKKISPYCIDKALKQVYNKDYELTLKKLISQAAQRITEKNLLKKNNLISRHLISRGYEPELVWKNLLDT